MGRSICGSGAYGGVRVRAELEKKALLWVPIASARHQRAGRCSSEVRRLPSLHGGRPATLRLRQGPSSRESSRDRSP